MKAAAYDYEKQRWLSGREAIAARLAQVIEDLALLRGPRGADYARWCNMTREIAIRRLESEKAQLEATGTEVA